MSATSVSILGFFRFCPSCGAGGDTGVRADGPSFLEGKRWLCKYCGFEYFHNVATAAGVIIDRQGDIVFVERSREPAKGKLGLPGGFVNPGESAEDAARRECREEIGWAPSELAFLGSFPNSYEYGSVAYNTCDLYFYYRFPLGEAMPRLTVSDDEVSAVRILSLGELREEDLAFPSLACAMAAYGRKRETREGKLSH